MKKVLDEWTLQAPWGKIALISWGNPQGQPVFLVHGRRDSAATFIPLLDLLPDEYYYVAIDLPGHGKSEPFPVGLKLVRFAYIVAVDFAIRNCKLKNFYYVAHSMGTEIGCFYNAIYPNKIRKFVHFDPIPALKTIQILPLSKYMLTYQDYYDNYNINNVNNKIYTKEKALESVMRSRKVGKGQAEVLLSRNLIEVGTDQYLLSWDRRTRQLATLNVDNDYYKELYTKNCPPTLLINALQSSYVGSKDIMALVEDIKKNESRTFIFKDVEGDHDVHFKHPERVARFVIDFLKQDFGGNLAKL